MDVVTRNHLKGSAYRWFLRTLGYGLFLVVFALSPKCFFVLQGTPPPISTPQ